MALSLEDSLRDACTRILDTTGLVRVVLSGCRRNMVTEFERIDIRPVGRWVVAVDRHAMPEPQMVRRNRLQIRLPQVDIRRVQARRQLPIDLPILIELFPLRGVFRQRVPERPGPFAHDDGTSQGHLDARLVPPLPMDLTAQE